MRRNTAFLVESVLLLVFLAASLAVLTTLFGQAYTMQSENRSRQAAVELAEEAAEDFCVDPESAQGAYVEDGMYVECDVVPTACEGGTLYEANISVYASAEDAPSVTLGKQAKSSGMSANDSKGALYELQTSRYVSNTMAGAQEAPSATSANVVPGAVSSATAWAGEGVG